MPIYEYLCDDCRERAELLVTGQQDPVCPKCGGKRLSKQFSTFATHAEGRVSTASHKHSHSPGCGCCHGPQGSCNLN